MEEKMQKPYDLKDYTGENWDDSKVIDKMPVIDVVEAYRKAGKDDRLILGWCISRRYFQYYEDMRAAHPESWWYENRDKVEWNRSYDIMKACRDNGLIDEWRAWAKVGQPNKTDRDMLKEDSIIEGVYLNYGPFDEDPKEKKEEYTRLKRKEYEGEKQEKKKKSKRHRRLFGFFL